jgi:hypothetical protein
MYLCIHEAGQRNAFKRNSPFGIHLYFIFLFSIDTYKVHLCLLLVHLLYAQHSGQTVE